MSVCHLQEEEAERSQAENEKKQRDKASNRPAHDGSLAILLHHSVMRDV